MKDDLRNNESTEFKSSLRDNESNQIMINLKAFRKTIKPKIT